MHKPNFNYHSPTLDENGVVVGGCRWSPDGSKQWYDDLRTGKIWTRERTTGKWSRWEEVSLSQTGSLNNGN